jgi:hypothetical protein
MNWDEKHECGVGKDLEGEGPCIFQYAVLASIKRK